jgi:predicted Zn-dependent protease
MLRQEQDTKLLSYAALAAMALSIINPVLAAGASSAAGAIQMKYLRQLEEEADYRGLQNMRQAGFDPHGMTRFLKQMGEEERLNPANVPPYFRSHPMSKDRLNYIESIVSSMTWNQTAPTNPFALRHIQAILRAVETPGSKSVAEYQHQVTETPNDPQALALLGVIQLRLNDLEHAKQTLAQASSKGCGSTMNSARCISDLGSGTRRVRRLPVSAKSIPRTQTPTVNSVIYFWQEGDLERATKECKTALSLDPQLDEPRHLRSRSATTGQIWRGASLLSASHGTARPARSRARSISLRQRFWGQHIPKRKK